MQISSENYINVLVELVKNLTIENAQLRAIIFDMKAETHGDNENHSDNEQN